MSLLLDAILVPQGSEFAAVQRGLGSKLTNLVLKDLVQSIPVGPEPLHRALKDWHPPQRSELQDSSPPRVLIMGLCGALTPNHGVGDVVLYDTCTDGITAGYGSSQACDAKLCQEILQQLQHLQPPIVPPVAKVQAITTAAVVCRAKDKLQLRQQSVASVVDMEGWVALQDLQQRGMAVAMLRVVSDDCHHDLPNLSAACGPEGQLLSLPLALAMIREPLGALRLIRGSLKALSVLERLAAALAS
jgi:Phosphorylase superfamily